MDSPESDAAMNQELVVFASAMFLDLVLGDPDYRLHPVRMIGNWAQYLEKYFFKQSHVSVLSGIFYWFLVVFPVTAIPLALAILLQGFQAIYASMAVQAFVLYSCIAFRDMIRHAEPVYEALVSGRLEEARMNLGKIVGRDTERLDNPGISRACIESVSESFVDGFLSPVFFWVAGVLMARFVGLDAGLAAMALVVVYRTSNTLDSLVGYDNEKYGNFGKFSARMDDVLNFLPARLSPFIIVPAVAATGGYLKKSILTFIRDRKKSASPNAGHSISLFAGALDVTLGGDTMYAGKILSKPVIGEGFKKPEASSIKGALNLFMFSGFFTVLFSSLVLMFVFI